MAALCAPPLNISISCCLIIYKAHKPIANAPCTERTDICGNLSLFNCNHFNIAKLYWVATWIILGGITNLQMSCPFLGRSLLTRVTIIFKDKRTRSGISKNQSLLRVCHIHGHCRPCKPIGVISQFAHFPGPLVILALAICVSKCSLTKLDERIF